MRKARHWYWTAAVLTWITLRANPVAAQAAELSASATLDARVEKIEQVLQALEHRLEAIEKNNSGNIGSVTTASSGAGSGAPSDLAERIAALDQGIRVIQRQRELEAEDAAAKAKAAPVAAAGAGGFTIRSADSAFVLNLHGTVQADTRLFPNGSPAPGASTFTATKARPIIDGVLSRTFSFKIMPDFGSGTTTLLDAYIDGAILPWLKIRAGKFKGPVGLERLVSDTDVEFYERALPANLVPNREVGAQLFGDLWGGVVSYAGGIFNGVADGGSADLDTDNHRELEGRVFLSPYRKTTLAALQGFGIGIAGTSGSQTGTLSAPVVAAYKDAAQQSFFRYRFDGAAAGTTVAFGNHSRITPQANYYWGPFGAWAEYVLSSQGVKRGALADTMDNASWQAGATYVLTGEKASYRAVAPLHPLAIKQRAWGAVEVGARYAHLSVDKSAFPLFADPLESASGARSWTLGVNWYANRNIKIVLNYEQTDFQAVAGGTKRKQERALLERFQLAF